MGALVLQFHIDQEIKIALMTNLIDRGNAKTSTLSLKNFEDIPSKPGGFLCVQAS